MRPKLVFLSSRACSIVLGASLAHLANYGRTHAQAPSSLRCTDPEIDQRKHGLQLRGALDNSLVAHFDEPELALENTEWMFEPHSNASLLALMLLG